MTIFGIDISNNNGPNIDMAEVAREGFSFVFCKVSEGDGFLDYTWPAYRDAARAAGLLVAGYHYLRADCDITAQAQAFVDHLGDAPAMIDFETGSGDIATFWRFVNACNALGKQIALSYVPHWYWQQIGAPDITTTPGLIQSSYVIGTGPASALYPGDDSPGWAPYGGAQPALLQFTDAAQVAGFSVDANAFRGTASQLAELLSGQPQGALMALTDAQQADLYEKVTDLWTQMLGPSGHGWPQLGKNPAGQALTPVDAEASLETQVAALTAAVAKIAAKVGA